MGIIHESTDLRLYHTKESLDSAGFSYVFDNNMFEVEEV